MSCLLIFKWSIPPTHQYGNVDSHSLCLAIIGIRVCVVSGSQFDIIYFMRIGCHFSEVTISMRVLSPSFCYYSVFSISHSLKVHSGKKIALFEIADCVQLNGFKTSSSALFSCWMPKSEMADASLHRKFNALLGLIRRIHLFCLFHFSSVWHVHKQHVACHKCWHHIFGATNSQVQRMYIYGLQFREKVCVCVCGVVSFIAKLGINTKSIPSSVFKGSLLSLNRLIWVSAHFVQFPL